MNAYDGLADYVEHFRGRVVQDAFAEATAAYWTRRAEAFDAAMPRAGDYTGAATVEQLEERRLRLAGAATACRCRAVVSIVGGDVP